MSENQLPKNLKKVREKLSLSQEKISAVCGISSATWGNYEAGESSPNSIFLQKVKDYYHVDINWLLTGSGDMFFDPENTKTVYAMPEEFIGTPTDVEPWRKLVSYLEREVARLKNELEELKK